VPLQSWRYRSSIMGFAELRLQRAQQPFVVLLGPDGDPQPRRQAISPYRPDNQSVLFQLLAHRSSIAHVYQIKIGKRSHIPQSQLVKTGIQLFEPALVNADGPVQKFGIR